MLRDGCYFLLAQKVTKDALGAASGEHLACGGAHSYCPQTPITRRRPPENLAFASGGSEHKTVHFSCLGDTGPYCVKMGKSLRCTYTAYPGKTVAAGPPDHHRT